MSSLVTDLIEFRGASMVAILCEALIRSSRMVFGGLTKQSRCPLESGGTLGDGTSLGSVSILDVFGVPPAAVLLDEQRQAAVDPTDDEGRLRRHLDCRMNLASVPV